MNPISDQIPQFIVTSGRSGSTMLARMLQRHPELVCMSDLIEPVGDVPFIDTERIVSSQDFLATLQAPSLPERIRFWRAQPTDELLHLPEHDADVSLLLTYALPFLQPDDPEGLLRDLCDAIGMREPATMAAHLFASFAWLRDRFGGTRWVERTGGSLPHAKKLVDTFPQGRFIHLHRDPAEVAISMQTGSFFRLYHLLEDNPALDRWDWNVVPEPAVLAAMLDRWEVAACQAWRALPNDQFLRIRYEDLMADGPHHLLRVLAFLLERCSVMSETGDTQGPPNAVVHHHLDSETQSIRHELTNAGWTLNNDEPWQLHWSNARPSAATYAALGPHQRVNHYPGIIPLVRKDELHDHLAFANADEGRPWRFPRSFSMPDELDELRAAANADPDRVWIVKERDGSMGRGMYLVHDIEKLEPDPETIVQEYIDDPMVFPDVPFKHVLRVYTLITMIDPLTAYAYPELVVKVTSQEWRPAAESIDELARHLTNPTVQMAHSDSNDPVQAIDRATFAQRLDTVGVSMDAVWTDIRTMIADVLQVFAPTISVLSSVFTPRPSSCFELVGFDLMLDSNAMPWLLECNMSPSLGTRSPADSSSGAAQRLAKEGAVAELLDVLGLRSHQLRSHDPIERVREETAALQRYEPLVTLGQPAGRAPEPVVTSRSD
ncbi:Tubulin polyglutamylase TTLL6 [Nymphon striatum]|nr:Tubulin polyglutamylase TTLL6 [Nymphon striatum]